jgi:hypothetical protein
MMKWVVMLLLVLQSACRRRSELVLENLALRQWTATFEQPQPRPQPRKLDRLFWLWPLRIWSSWQSASRVVQPASGFRLHCQGFLS